MKHRVNPAKSGGELEPDRHRINHLGDAVWPNESGRQLTRRRLERQILGRKPIITIKPSIKCQSMLKMENSVLFRRQNTKFVQKPYEIKILHFGFLF